MRYFGHSNYSAEQARHAAQVAAEAGLDGFISSQIEYSLLHRTPEAELLPTAQDLGLGVFPYFPLANGLLTGKYTRDGGERGGSARSNPTCSRRRTGICWTPTSGSATRRGTRC
ncbi:aldo/keto reductase [Tessaracoccus defluvii]|uniref:aldo/keto reductase n=1 Tax=Tessaracoccus defluvii TaxID=1285901 RepID=UPI0021F703C9|nr:aldo/keto reductase [Tessaracoccus defluvii]